MRKLLARRCRSSIGIDIGLSTLTLVELSCSKNHVRIKQALKIPLPDKSVERGIIIDPAPITAVLKTTLKTIPLSTRSVQLAMPDALVSSHVIQIPQTIKPHHREEWVWVEATRLLPCALEDMAIDYSLLKSAVPDESNWDCGLVAARKEHVALRTQVVTDAGLHVEGVELESLAVWRWCRQYFTPLEPEPNALLVIAATSLSVVVVCRGWVCFFHHEPINTLSHEAEVVQNVVRIFQLMLSLSIAKLWVSGEWGVALEAPLQEALAFPVQCIDTTRAKDCCDATYFAASGLALRGHDG